MASLWQLWAPLELSSRHPVSLVIPLALVPAQSTKKALKIQTGPRNFLKMALLMKFVLTRMKTVCSVHTWTSLTKLMLQASTQINFLAIPHPRLKHLRIASRLVSVLGQLFSTSHSILVRTILTGPPSCLQARRSVLLRLAHRLLRWQPTSEPCAFSVQAASKKPLFDFLDLFSVWLVLEFFFLLYATLELLVQTVLSSLAINLSTLAWKELVVVESKA
mmetsp:Transcript_19463/g.38126  ORF Transcript_19463/g.38126 Transcript_19463/m.38126 type:complete len:219 (-) Transcript_19463:66-722(-)